jgi:hypothetical protein
LKKPGHVVYVAVLGRSVVRSAKEEERKQLDIGKRAMRISVK